MAQYVPPTVGGSTLTKLGPGERRFHLSFVAGILTRPPPHPSTPLTVPSHLTSHSRCSSSARPHRRRCLALALVAHLLRRTTRRPLAPRPAASSPRQPGRRLCVPVCACFCGIARRLPPDRSASNSQTLRLRNNEAIAAHRLPALCFAPFSALRGPLLCRPVPLPRLGGLSGTMAGPESLDSDRVNFLVWR